MDSNVIVDKIKSTDDYSRSYILEDKKLIDLFMSEYRRKSNEISELKRINYQGYDISIYAKNYFAIHISGKLAFDKKGQLGFENDMTDPMTVNLLSKDLSGQILAKLQ